MKAFGAFEVKTHFSAFLKKAANGEQFLITRNGHPIAKLVPSTSVDRDKVDAAIDRLLSFAKTGPILGLDWKQLRDEGRKG